MGNKFHKQLLFIWGIIVFVLIAAFTGQAQMSPQEMLKKADEARGSYEGVEVNVLMESFELGRKQYRAMKISEKGYNCLLVTLAPPNVKNQRILMRERNLWYSNPGLSKPVPVSPRQKLMGSAVNGDIVSTNYTSDYKIVSTENTKVQDEDCILMHLEAIDDRTTYDRIKYWISKDRLVGVKAEFYTVSGKLFKSATFEYNNRVTIKGNPREFVSQTVITSAIIKDDYTIIKYGKPLLKKIPDAVFNVNLLTK